MTMNDSLLRNGLAALQRGWKVIPLRGKVPTKAAWTKAKGLTSGEINRAVYEGNNLGVQTGLGFVVVDTDNGCDAELLGKLQAINTPTTRTGSGGFHFYFAGDAKCSVGKISEHVDVRGKGGQVVLPGSIHPDTGEAYAWIITPDEAEFAPLPPFIEAMVTAARKIRKAATGTRNDTLNRATYAAASAGAPTRELADAAAESGLEHGEIEATINSATRAAPKFVPYFPQGEVLVPGTHFFNTGEEVNVDQTEFCNNAWARIPEGMFFTRLGVLGNIEDNVFQPVDQARFRVLVSEFLPLFAFLRDGRQYIREYRLLSQDLASLMIAAGPAHTEHIRAIVCHPLSRGPHPGWMVRDASKIEPVTDHRAFWHELLIDFPFASEHDLNAFVAHLLTIVCKPRIRGPVPIFIITATQPRTGKTKLVTDVAATVYGRPIANIALGDDDAEIDKRLIARALSAHTYFSFDNVRARVDSAVLAAFATSSVYSSRILGKSQTVEFQNDAIITITGNNTSASEEIAKRSLHIRLESKLDHPELRTDFKHPDLLAYLDEMRPKMLGSLLAMAELSGPAFIIGGCEDWGRIVGGAMAAAGMPLSVEAYTKFTSEADDEAEDVRMLVNKLGELEQAYSTDEILNTIKSLGIMPRVLDAPTERGCLTRLGFALRAINGRVFGNLRIQSEGTGSRKAWRVQRAG